MSGTDLSLETALAAFRQPSEAWETRVVLRPAEPPETETFNAPMVLFRRAGESQSWVELGHDRRPGDDRQRFVALGLSRRRWEGGAKAWGRPLGPDLDALGLSRTIGRLWEAAYPDLRPEIQVLAQHVQPPTNPTLLEAIRAAAERQDEPTRKALYAAIANAQLLVPIDPDTVARGAAEQRPRSFGDDGGGLASWGAFSDWDALRQWAPGGHAFGAVHGADFLSHVHDQGRCCVRINPDGVVGGELYPAEVKMMVEAVRRFYRSAMS